MVLHRQSSALNGAAGRGVYPGAPWSVDIVGLRRIRYGRLRNGNSNPRVGFPRDRRHRLPQEDCDHFPPRPNMGA